MLLYDQLEEGAQFRLSLIPATLAATQKPMHRFVTSCPSLIEVGMRRNQWDGIESKASPISYGRELRVKV